MKSYNLFPTIPFRRLVFSVGDINRSRVTHPRVSMPISVEKPNKLRLFKTVHFFLVSVINVSYIFHFYHLILVASLICTIFLYSRTSTNGHFFTTATSLTLQRPILLLLRRFVFLIVEASAKREWLVMNRRGPWEGYSFLPAFLCAHIFIERETSGYEADNDQFFRKHIPYIDSCLNLPTTVTFFCAQGGHCKEVQL